MICVLEKLLEQRHWYAGSNQMDRLFRRASLYRALKIADRLFSWMNMCSETVCAEMAEMQSKGIPVKRVSVNLSRVNVKYSNIVMKLRKAIDQFQVQPQNLAIELTESAILMTPRKFAIW